MTLPATTIPQPARAEDVLGDVATQEGTGRGRHHVGCYWDLEQAAWVPHTPVPVPRPPMD
ncbi:hypothetical protein ACI789_19240 [Geodermatophilus sp. SYSU D00965]